MRNVEVPQEPSELTWAKEEYQVTLLGHLEAERLEYAWRVVASRNGIQTVEVVWNFDDTAFQERQLKVNVRPKSENEYEIYLTHSGELVGELAVSLLIEEMIAVYHTTSEIISSSVLVEKEQAKQYWMELLADFDVKTRLPTDNVDVISDNTIYEYVHSPLQMTNLREFISNENISISSLFYTAWGIFLQRYNHTDDVVFGIGFDQDGIVSMNRTLPLRFRTFKGETVRQVVHSVEDMVQKHLKHSSTSLIQIISHSGLDRNELLYDSVLYITDTLDNQSPPKALLTATDAQFQLPTPTLSIRLTPDSRLVMKYKTTAFTEETIQAIAARVENILCNLLVDSASQIQILELYAKDEYKVLVDVYNRTDLPSLAGTILDLIEHQVKQSPRQPAIAFGNTVLTYEELDQKTYQLAHYLRSEQQVGPETLIGIMMERSPFMVIAMLGIIKAGAAYVPIEPSFPLERIKSIITDAQIGLVLCTRQCIPFINKLQWECTSFHTYVSLDSEDINIVEASNALMDEKLWGYIAEEATNEIAGGGWYSSYTGEEFSACEMEEYATNTYMKLAPYLHQEAKVLEIGCASGISMFRIAPEVSLYYGTDLSRPIIEKNKQRVESEGIGNIMLECMQAHEIDRIQENNFDIIILNSVIQYFAGYNYLRMVIQKAVSLLSGNGILYLGDLMDMELKDELISSLIEFRETNPELKFKTKIDFTNELFVSRDFLHDLQVEIPSIQKIDFSSKIHTIENELTRFRYDALITVNKEKTRPADIRTKRKHQLGSGVLASAPISWHEKPGPDDLAYVIYTSGSTGQPKGVMIEHKNLVNFVNGMKNSLLYVTNGIFLALTNISFDISILELLVPLTIGCKIVIANDEEQLNPKALHQMMQKHQVNIVQVTPSRLQLLLSDPNGCRLLASVQTLLVGGEALPDHVLKTVRQISNAMVYNMYGPTETTIWSGVKLLNNDSKVTIGSPIANTKFYILDKDGQIMPEGFPGELCIAGDGVARGYLNQLEMTAKRFVANPFAKGGRMYKTGDWAKRLPHGEIMFLGRIDHQVKIRGYRIELGDIEEKLLGHLQVQEAVVLAQSDDHGKMTLCAYYVGEVVSQTELREYLTVRLPEYMIPTHFISIEKMPLTPSGKIDRKELSGYQRIIEVGSPYEPPRNDKERTLQNIWQDILGVAQIGMLDNFFELGGNSLKAGMLVSSIRKVFNVELTITQVFRSKTIRNLLPLFRQMETKIYTEIEVVEPREFYPVSSAQKRLYVLEKVGDVQLTYNIPEVFLIEGELDVQRLQSVIDKLVQRHESLRTSFDWMDGELVQFISPTVHCPIKSQEVPEEQLEEHIRSFIQPFQLEQASLFRVELLKLAEHKYILMYDMHHIIADGLSLQLLLHELVELYKGTELPELRITYKDFSEWQNRLFAAGAFRHQEEYWVNRLSGTLPVVELPTDYPRPAIQSFEGNRVVMKVDAVLTAKLKKLAVQTSSTLYMVLLAAYNTLLAKYTGQDDIIVGTIAAGRPHADMEHLIGMFANTLAIRSYPHGEKAFDGFIEEIKDIVLKAFENQDFQFEELVDRLQLKRDLSRNPLFDTLFVMQNMVTKSMEFGDATIKPYPLKHQSTKFELTVEAFEEQDTITLYFDYCTKLFKNETVEQMTRHFHRILERVANTPNIALWEINILSEAEKKQLLVAFNDTYVEYSDNKCIHELIEEQAKKTPNNIAVVYDDQPLTYCELNEKANRLARLIRGKGVHPDELIGIMADRSLEMIIGMLAILKSGAAFMPVDPAYPQERINYLLEDSRTKILLIQEHLLEKAQFNGEIIRLVDQEDNMRAEGGSDLEPIGDATNLAYVIYTSGSTGNPKGVMIEHRSLVNLSQWHKRNFRLTYDDRATKYAAFGFDASVWELFPYLIAGASVYIIPEQIRLDVYALNEFYERNLITITWLPPQVYEQFLELQNTTLRFLLTGGDKVRAYSHVPYEVINTYGPTESTVICTSYNIQKDNYRNIPIGMPIDNIQLYILDRNNRLVPLGVKGELCITGDGLGRGYWGRNDLTEEKFIDNPFVPGKKMYKTGDLARWLPDGNMEYLGRMDFQVKIRGFRIELSEVESHLLNHPDIQKAVVIAKEDVPGHKYLCAYLVADKRASLSELRSYISQKLPDYMIPLYFIYLDKMPLTPNGKLDASVLPDPKESAVIEHHYEAPKNEIQENLVDIWQQVLAREKVSIYDNFFELGGDSIKALQISARLQKYQLKMDTADLFKNPRINELSRYVKKRIREVNQGIIEGETGLTPIQSAFFASKPVDSHYYNQSYILFRQEGFDIAVISQVFQRIIEHHDALRTVFKETEYGVMSIILDIGFKAFTLEVIHFDGDADEKIVAEVNRIQSSLNLSDGPLMKLGLFQTRSGDHLLITVHHLLIDGVSWRILFEDLAMGYKQAIAGKTITFPSKTDSIQVWTKELARYADSGEVLKQIPYWNDVVSNVVKPLPKEHQAPTNLVEDADKVSILLSQEDTGKLLYQANQAYNTEINDLLLVAFGLAVKEMSRQDLVLIDLEGHGREPINELIDVSRTIGWFTSVYPVVLNMEKSDDLSLLIKSTKETLRKIPQKGIGYGILEQFVGAELKTQLQAARRPELSFNYLGQYDQDIPEGVFKLSALSSESEVSKKALRSYTLELNGFVLNGQLYFDCSYNRHEYEVESMQSFMNSFKYYLLNVIQHCVLKETSEKTLSDFSSKGLDMDDLENIYSLFE